ncbi:DUF4817 domain-containing protein [Nephila pilipes]|uniref:DUF4817 domain-containing protein n=1 Tax=Nephila pilipes TaxID=299642 RepID=A0A8X6IWU5_NEPPI|nr:DUF4817 domain-containing protein [Nephila pilipes]
MQCYVYFWCVRSTLVYDALFDKILKSMYTPQEKAQTLWYFIEAESIMQQKLRKSVQNNPPFRYTILRKKTNFIETGNIVDKKRSARLCTSDVDVEHVRDILTQSLGICEINYYVF